MVASKEQLLANHSMTHQHLSNQPLETFKSELATADSLLNPFSSFRKWYRFPYLDYGDRKDKSKRKQLSALRHLKHSGYIHGYITISTLDWYANHLLIAELKNNHEMDLNVFKEDYIALLKEWIEEYDKSWQRCLWRPFVHVLLLHQNDINLLFLEDIVAMIKSMGWEIVSPDEAYADPIPLLANFGHVFPKFIHPKTLTKEYVEENTRFNH